MRAHLAFALTVSFAACGSSSTIGDAATPTLDASVPADLSRAILDSGVPPDLAIPTCTDGVKNGSETDVDCGGTCSTPCGDSKGCKSGNDCTSLVCTGGTCAAPTCGDSVKNGNESDIDCGGVCPACGDGKSCGGVSDCVSMVCTNGKCQTATCSDGTKNGKETDIDCGATCAPCAIGKGCGVASDCVTGVCMTNTCAAASCTDGKKNGSETDNDCGGASCPGCGDGKACMIAKDCTSSVCKTNLCQSASCSDGVKNGTETDIDCGGNCTTPCAAGKACSSAADCASGVCTGGVCQTATCTDGVKNGNETDVDCGGSCASTNKCGTGKHCGGGADCASLVCTATLCVAASCSDSVKNGNETDVDCGGACPACTKVGAVCSGAGDCAFMLCDTGKCRRGKSCLELHTAQPAVSDGAAIIDPDGASGPIAEQTLFCDMTTDGGGWTLVHKNNGSSSNDRTDTGFNVTALSNATINDVAVLPRATIWAINPSAEWRVIGNGGAYHFYSNGGLPYYTTDNHTGITNVSNTPQLKYSWGASYVGAFTPAQQYTSHGPCICPPGTGCSGPDTGHLCLQRFCCGAPNNGFWFNGTGHFTAGYYPGTGWVR